MSFAKGKKALANAAIVATCCPTLPSQNSAKTIAENDDMIREILLRLPLKSLTRFKSVSKHWLSLISDPIFYRRHNSSISGLIFSHSYVCGFRKNIKKFSYVDLDSSEPPSSFLNFLTDSDLRISHSCSGLMLLCTSDDVKFGNNYVCNPTTNECTLLPPLHRTIFGLTLAFDPSVSPYYKVVCVRESYTKMDHHQIDVYSMQTRRWGPSGDPFHVDADFSFGDGVFVKGNIHWISTKSRNSLYFNVDEERVMQMPMPMPVYLNNERRSLRYFGESRGHVHLVAYTYYPQPSHLDVYEMKTDCSGWFVKFQVNLSVVATLLPMIITKVPFERDEFIFSTVCVVRGETDQESYLVLETPGAIIRYNFCTKTVQKICDDTSTKGNYVTHFFKVHQYVKTLAFV